MLPQITQMYIVGPLSHGVGPVLLYLSRARTIVSRVRPQGLNTVLLPGPEPGLHYLFEKGQGYNTFLRRASATVPWERPGLLGLQYIKEDQGYCTLRTARATVPWEGPGLQYLKKGQGYCILRRARVTAPWEGPGLLRTLRRARVTVLWEGPGLLYLDKASATVPREGPGLLYLEKGQCYSTFEKGQGYSTLKGARCYRFGVAEGLQYSS